MSPTYRCVVTKNIIVPQKDWSWGLATSGGIFELAKVVDLPFPPQIGMSLSEFTELAVLSPKDGSYVDGLKFHSGRIENINWNNDRKQFECMVAAHELSSIDELGVMLVKHVVGGWSADRYAPDSIANNAIRASLERWLREIDDRERGTHQSLTADREQLDRAHKILRHSGFSGASAL